MKKILSLTLICLISYTTQSQTANWSAVLPAKFPTNVSGQIHGISRVSQMKFHHNNAAKMYAVSARGGLFITTDTGANWTLASGCDNLPNGTRLASVCVDFTNDNIIYLGTGDHNYYSSGRGVYKSTDGGATFTATTLTSKIVVDMIMDPLNNNIIVAATNTGIYKTTNGGSTWTLKSTSIALDDLKQKHPTSRTLFTATNTSDLYRSDDFGDTWTQVTNGIVLPSGVTSGAGCRIAVTPADTSVVYFGMIANGGMLYKSTDGGNSFTAMKTTASPYLSYYDDVSTSSSQGDYNFGLGADRNNASIVYFVAHCVWKSTNSGTSWSKLTNWWAGCHTDMHQMVTSPYNNNKLYNANDGGIFLSTDGGTNWTPKSDGMYGYEIYHGNCSPTRRDMISIGTQDNGELYSTSTGWFTNRGGDWTSQCAFDYRTNSSMVYYYGNNKRRLVNGSDATYNLPTAVTTLQDIAFNRKNSNLAFVGNLDIYRTNNVSASSPAWTKISSFNKTIKAIHSSLADTNKLYVITNDGFIYVSNDVLSASPIFTAYSLPNTTNNAAAITSISNNANVLYATFNTKAYKSIDNGATWTNITYNLPATNHIEIISDEYFPATETVILATGNAIYYKTVNATSWTIYNTNLPIRTNLVDMSIYNDGTNNTVLRATTYGRGMWETNINNLRTVTPSFTANTTQPCLGASVQFTDNSTGNVVSRNWSFTGGTPATSTEANPVVAYNTAGVYNVTLTVSDGTTNSTTSQTNYISSYGGSLPINEGFEGTLDPPLNWKNIDNGTVSYMWAKSTVAGGFGLSASSMIFDNYSWNIPGQKDELQTARYDARAYSTATLNFDVAYQEYSGYSDSLAVFVSTDCGNSFTKVYQKGGATLSTNGSGTNDFIPTATQWRKETINLNSYLGSHLIFKFQNINGYGNNVYIDNINVTATISANAGNDVSICIDDSVTIGTTAVEGLSYSWLPLAGLNNANISNPKVSPNATTSYVLTTTQTLSGISNKDTVIVSVKQKSLSSTTTSICSNQLPFNWNGLAFTAVGSQTAYLTNAAGCDSAATLNLIVNQPTSSTTNISACSSYNWNGNTYTTSGTYTYNSINSKGCDSIATLNLTIKTTSASSSTTNICPAQLPYNWNGLVFNSAGTQTAHLINSIGCDSAATLVLTVGNAVTPSISITTVSNVVCSGSSVTFNAIANNTGSTPTYQWQKNSINVGAGTSITFLAGTLSSNDIINCRLTANNVCQTTATAVSNDIVLTVKASPIIGVNSISSTLFCTIGSNRNINNTNTLGGGVWSSNNNSVVSITTISSASGYITAIDNGAAMLTYTKTSANGCISSASTSVLVAAAATPNAITGATSICKASTTTLSTTTIGGVWSSQNGYATVNNSGVVTAVNAGAAVIKYTVTNGNGCSASATKNITVNAIPSIPSIGYAVGTTNPQTGAGGGFCNNRNFTLVGTPNGGVWSSTGGFTINPTSGAASTTTLGAASVTYTVTNAGGCSNSRTINGTIVTCAARGVNTNQAATNSTSFTIYPNPARSIVSLNFNTLIGAGTIVITDLYGKQMKVQPLSMGANTIDISKFSKGMYFVSTITSEGKATKKLVVEQ